MRLYKNVNVLVTDETKGIEQLEEEGVCENIAMAHVIIHQGKVLKNAFVPKFKDT